MGLSCKGCKYEFNLRGVMRCALGEKHGIRCTKWPGKEMKK